VEKVEPFVGSSKDQFPGRTQQAPAPVITKDETLVAEVEAILDHRYHHRQLQYLVKFVKGILAVKPNGIPLSRMIRRGMMMWTW
jgi:hypothetical protein